MFWIANSRDAELHLTETTAGNGVVLDQEFDPDTGLIQRRVEFHPLLPTTQRIASHARSDDEAIRRNTWRAWIIGGFATN